MIRSQHNAAPEKPFLLYYAPAAPHAPHHVGQEWIERYRGRFDDGWDAMRERIVTRQQELAVVPKGATPTPRPAWVQAWEELSKEERRLYARMHEVFAGVMSHIDAQIGRLVATLNQLGLRDDTIIVVLSDNGASAEGGPHGTLNELGISLGSDETVQSMVEQMDSIGSPHLYNHYSWGWAWAGNTPFWLWKRYTWLGGTRTPLIINWPGGVRSRGEVRGQFCHAVDVIACDHLSWPQLGRFSSRILAPPGR